MLFSVRDRLLPLPWLSAPVQVVRQFTPNWFTVTMGTGIVALALSQVPGGSVLSRLLGRDLWLADIVLFVLFAALYLARWVVFFSEARRILDHSAMSMFLGAIPMGLATIVNGFLVFGPDLFGGTASFAIARALWCLDALFAIGCGLLVPFLMITRQSHAIESMTAIWLLPVVAAEVAAASGAQLVPLLPDPLAAFRLLVLDYALWAFSVPLALGMLVLLLLRLVLHKLPHASMAASAWLALGPIGTGALGLLLLGRDAPAVCAAVGQPALGAVAAGIGVLGGAILWGYGAWWLLLAVLVTWRYRRDGIPFNLGWWGFVFPPGVYALATFALGRQTGIALFGTLGIAMTALLLLVWIVVAARTAAGAWRGELFFAPCLPPGPVAVPA